MKDRPCPRTVFRQTQKTRNVCLKRRFQFAGKKQQIENPSPFARKELAYFSLRFAPVRPCFTYGRTKTGQSSTSLQKGEHFPFALPPFYPLLQRRIKTKRGSGIIIYLLKHFHKVSQRSETLAIPQKTLPTQKTTP